MLSKQPFSNNYDVNGTEEHHPRIKVVEREDFYCVLCLNMYKCCVNLRTKFLQIAFFAAYVMNEFYTNPVMYEVNFLR